MGILKDSQDWKIHLKSREYYRIYPRLIESVDDREIILSALELIVPKRKHGDGIEIYEDFILPHEADTPEMESASWLLLEVRKVLTERYYMGPGAPFKIAVSRAINILKDNGIEYQGIHKTFIYSTSKNKYKQIDGMLRHKIYLKGEEKLKNQLYDDGRDFYGLYNYGFDMENYKKSYNEITLWLNKYPWRISHSLFMLNNLDWFEINTPLWYAIQILYTYEKNIKIEFGELIGSKRIKNMSREDLAHSALNISVGALQIGQFFEAINKKEIEYEVIKAREGQILRTTASGKKSSDSKTKRLESFMHEIEQLGDLFPRMNADAIEDQAFDNAVKKDPNLWSQGLGQKENYLSKYIRSEDPWKSRYNTIFYKIA